MKSIGSIFGGLIIILIVFNIMLLVGNESVTNSNVDTESVLLVAQVETGINTNFNYTTSFNEFDSNLTTNATFDSQDVFAQEFLEGKSEGQQKQGLISNIVKVPDLFILSLGVPQSSVIWIKGILLLVISVLLSFAAYRAFFGGGKITDN